jgi:hypothetical protein
MPGGWKDQPPTAIADREALDAFVADSNPDALPARLRPTWRRKAWTTSIASIAARSCKVAAALMRSVSLVAGEHSGRLRFAGIAIAKPN